MTNRDPAHQASTIDLAEKARFQQLAAMWWDPDGPMWPLHGLNRFRQHLILTQIMSWFDCPEGDQPLAGLQILDVGCGGGLLTEYLCSLGAEVTGIDVADNNIHIARQHAAHSAFAIRYRTVEPGRLVAEGEQFDIVTNLEVVEHVADVSLFMQTCHQLIKPGGLTIIATINRTWQAWLIAIIGAEKVLKLLPSGTHQWHKLVKPDEIHHWLRRDGLAPVWHTGVAFNPFTRRFRCRRSLAVNYMLAAGKQR